MISTGSYRRTATRWWRQLVLWALLIVAGCDSPHPTHWSAVVARTKPAVRTIGDDRQSLATAFAIAPHILATSDHVLTAQPLYLIDAHGKRSRLQRLIRDRDNDMALLKTAAHFERPLRLATRKPKVGEPVLALGNPFGAGVTATAGIVSALPKAINETTLLQTDAAINPGNSGGPLLDAQGRVIGMVVARGAPAAGIGFAVPAQTIRAALERLQTSDR